MGERLAEIFPEGVVNVLSGSGDDIGDALVGHPKVRMISITGDTATGKRIARIASDSVKRLHLELGGKAPVIVFDDADLDAAAERLLGNGPGAANGLALSYRANLIDRQLAAATVNRRLAALR